MKKLLSVILAAALLLCLVAVPVTVTGASTYTSDDFVFAKSTVSGWEGDTITPELLTQGKFEGLEYEFRSSDQKIASVDTVTGEVTCRAKGSCTITATVTLGKKDYVAKVKVNVKRRSTGIEVDESASGWKVLKSDDVRVAELLPDNELPVLLLQPGATVTVEANVLPAAASDRKYTVSAASPDGDAAEAVTVSGTSVRAVKSGECLLTVACHDDETHSVQYYVLVVDPVTGLTVEAESSTMIVGQGQQLTAALTPGDATIQTLRWASSDEKVATVDEQGYVTAVGQGACTVTCYARDGSGVRTSVKLSVDLQPTRIVIREDGTAVSGTATVPVGGKKTFTASVQPKTLDDRTVTWSSSDTDIAKVNSKGVVTGVSQGSCVSTAASKLDGSVQASFTVNAVQLVESVTLDHRGYKVYMGETLDLSDKVTIAPENADDQRLSWSSSDKKVAKVSSKGIVTPVKAGSCKVTATARDGSGAKYTVNIKVIQPVTGVSLRYESYNVGVNCKLTIKPTIKPSDATNKNMTWTVDDPTIATVTSSGANAVVRGLKWGTTTLHGVTEDGGYECSATIRVGLKSRALKVTDLYVSGNAVKLTLRNLSNMHLTHITTKVEMYDMYGDPLPCNSDGSNYFLATYSHSLYSGSSTEHGRWSFQGFVQPQVEIGRVELRVLSYSTVSGYTYRYSSYHSPYSYAAYEAAGYPIVEPDPEPTDPDPTEP